ncbi:DUF7519 family protein [Halorussus amylolyticus]|uniref:DUF7519 family protein n=1 Tax=Halorussus amylolyticus TaxID=1126242 RepID=UPI0010448A90|nr:hypothetical protein [Halorussus amylolyticus]
MTDETTLDGPETDAASADVAVSKTNWAPTRTSTAVVLVGTAAGVTLLSRAAGVGTGVAVSVSGALILGLALWLLTVEQWRAPATLAASLLLVPAGGAVAAGVGYELLVEFAASFPAPDRTGVVGQTLRILGVAAVLVGCTFAALGAVASVRNVAERRTVGRCWGLVVRAALLPVGVALALAGRALVTEMEILPIDDAADRASSTFTDAVFAPTATDPQLASFWVVLTVATAAAFKALVELPTRELAGDSTIGEIEVAEIADAVERGASVLAFVAFAGLPLALLVGVVVPAADLRAGLPPEAYRLLADATTNTGVRRALVGITAVSVGIAVAARLVRSSIRTPTSDLLAGYAPYVAGLAIVAGAGVVHERVLDGLLGFVAGRLDAPLADEFRRLSGNVVEFYGSETIVVGLLAVVAVLAAGGLFALWVAFALGFVPDRVGGPSLAGGGLFVAAGFAGTLDTPLWVVLVGAALALAVWDAGEFATTLGAEVGRRAETRRVELLHAVGTVSVGGLAVAAAVGLAGAVPSGPEVGALDAAGVALLGAVGAVVALVMALR